MGRPCFARNMGERSAAPLCNIQWVCTLMFSLVGVPPLKIECALQSGEARMMTLDEELVQEWKSSGLLFWTGDSD